MRARAARAPSPRMCPPTRPQAGGGSSRSSRAGRAGSWSPATASNRGVPRPPQSTRRLLPQDRFEAALQSHRELWLAEFDARKAAFEADFAARRAELDAELKEKVREKRAVKNMMLTLVFVLRLLA